MSRIEPRDRLIVALDTADIAQARELVTALGSSVTFYKVGLVLQLARGVEEFVTALIAGGKRVFLDYKYYDIEETMRKAVSRAAQLGVSFLTVHGPSKLIRAAAEAKAGSGLKLFNVTVLTSLDVDDVEEMGFSGVSVEQLVLSRARKALEAGCDGVIASGLEARSIKSITGDKLLVVTPGIRPPAYGQDEQKRRTTATSAIESGADYLVIGRPITGDSDPRGRAEEFVDEIAGAQQ